MYILDFFTQHSALVFLHYVLLSTCSFSEVMGIKGLDALHLACAEELKVDYFVTCDDRMIRKYTGTIVVINPVELTMHVLQQETDNADS